MKFFEEFRLQKNCEINVLMKTFLGLVEMTSGLVNASFSLPEWQAVKMTFFAPFSISFIFLDVFFFVGVFLLLFLLEQCGFLGNCLPTPPPSQHFAPSQY